MFNTRGLPSGTAGIAFDMEAIGRWIATTLNVAMSAILMNSALNGEPLERPPSPTVLAFARKRLSNSVTDVAIIVAQIAEISFPNVPLRKQIVAAFDTLTKAMGLYLKCITFASVLRGSETEI